MLTQITLQHHHRVDQRLTKLEEKASSFEGLYAKWRVEYHYEKTRQEQKMHDVMGRYRVLPRAFSLLSQDFKEMGQKMEKLRQRVEGLRQEVSDVKESNQRLRQENAGLRSSRIE